VICAVYDDLKIIFYPDPRLKKASTPVMEFTPALKDLAAKMFQLMREARGVGPDGASAEPGGAASARAGPQPWRRGPASQAR